MQLLHDILTGLTVLSFTKTCDTIVNHRKRFSHHFRSTFHDEPHGTVLFSMMMFIIFHFQNS